MNDQRDDLLKRAGAYGRKRQRDEALAPLPESFHDQMVAQIQDALAADAPDADDSEQADAPRRAPWLALAASLLGAVALTVWLFPAGAPGSLPRYALEMSGGASVRSAAATAPFEVGDQLRIVLRPAIAADAQPALAIYRQDAGTLHPVTMPAARWSADGAARIDATLDGVTPIPPGRHELLFVLAPAGKLPNADTVRAVVAGTRNAEGWQLLRTSVELRAQ